MKKPNKLSLISTSLLTAAFLFGGAFLSGDANALTAQVKGVGIGSTQKTTTFQVKRIELSSTKIPEFNGLKIEGPLLDRFASLNDKLKQATGRDGHALLRKYATVTVFDGNNIPHTLTGFASDGTPIVGIPLSQGPIKTQGPLPK